MDPIEQLTIETPEQVALEYPLAGVGSRCLAFFYDSLIQFVAFLSILVLGLLIEPDLGRYWPSAWNWTAALYTLVIFCLYWGYFAFFETVWKGQTPGKRNVGIRVIGHTGRSITVFEAIARNLMRVVDGLPGMYGVGCVSMFVDKKNRRLGDLVANTVVVHERKDEASQPIWTAPVSSLASTAAVTQQVSLAELEVIEAFLSRRIDLPPPVRQQTAKALATRVGEKLKIAPELRPSDEDFLESISHQLRSSASYR